MDDFRQRLVQCFATVFPNLGPDEITQASPASVGSWDSLATINLVTVLEEEFGIQFPPEDLECLVSFELILNYLESKLVQVS
ncbi:MAG TPA: acyl carrier protein [Gemmataceae bacterium]|nr:acyl carrier protein [Gemmataceae bacterium]